MHRTSPHLLSCFAALFLLASPARAQNPEPGTLRVFLDCQSVRCDFNYFRTNIPWLDWMRDQEDADVHVLVTGQGTGGGGHRYTLTFLGRGRFAGRADTLAYVAPAASTDDALRQGLAQRIRVGVVAFAARTGLLERLTIEAEAGAAAAEETRATADPWHAWVFSLRANTNLDGEASYRGLRLSGGVTASRVTPRLKLRFALRDGYSASTYELTEGTTHTVTRSYSLSTLGVHSLSGKWSAGLLASGGASTYANYALAVRAGPALEYDLFRYDESTRRQLTFLYSVGGNYYGYAEPTIYGKTVDRLIDQALNVSLELRQPWGSVSTSVEGSQFLNWSAGPAAPAELRANDGAKYALTLAGGIDVRLLRGLSLNAFGHYARIHNQVALPASGASDQDILLQLHQVGTSYRYRMYAGLRYTFGSIHNNIVNPRFSSVGDGGMLIEF